MIVIDLPASGEIRLEPAIEIERYSEIEANSRLLVSELGSVTPG